jgi:hypothetical protein
LAPLPASHTLPWLGLDSIPKGRHGAPQEIASHGSFERVVVRSDCHEDKSWFAIAGQFLRPLI